jgi:hypothetical protein
VGLHPFDGILWYPVFSRSSWSGDGWLLRWFFCSLVAMNHFARSRTFPLLRKAVSHHINQSVGSI